MMAHLLSAWLLSGLAVAPQVQLGSVGRVGVASNADGRVTFQVTGVNPCGAVHFIYGDGTAVTHPIVELPTTVSHTYSRSGDYRVLVEGRGNCQGVVETSVRATVRQAGGGDGDLAQGAGRGRGFARGRSQTADGMRFAPMDLNRDGAITRDEWRGSESSFRVHDWNADGVLSGPEVEPAGSRPELANDDSDRRWRSVPDWSRDTFEQLDRDRDGGLTILEWYYDDELFRRVDRDRNLVVTVSEFTGDMDDDRDDRFEDLDLNSDGYLSGTEWHGSAATFGWLDRDGDRRLSRLEVLGEQTWVPPGTSSGSSGSGDMVHLRIFAHQAWQDTGIIVNAGEELIIRATGEIQWTERAADRASAAGSIAGGLTGGAPLPNVYAGALIARIDQSRPFVAIERDGRVRMPEFGRLLLGINDDNVTDNRGFFDVTVEFVR